MNEIERGRTYVLAGNRNEFVEWCRSSERATSSVTYLDAHRGRRITAADTVVYVGTARNRSDFESIEASLQDSIRRSPDGPPTIRSERVNVGYPTPTDYTSEEIRSIVSALKKRDFDAVVALMKVLEVVDPAAAVVIYVTISELSGNGDAGGFDRSDHHLPGGGW